MTSPVTNAAAMTNPSERLNAMGMTPPRRDPSDAFPLDGIGQSGGMNIKDAKTYGDDTLLVRFSRQFRSGRKQTVEDQMASSWWLTKDLFTWLLSRATASSRGIKAVMREQLLLPPEWNEADCIVQAFPKRGVSLGAWFGPPRSVKPDGKVTSWTAATEAKESWMYQVYIPGLGRFGHLGQTNTGNALKWLEFEGLYSMDVIDTGKTTFPALAKGSRFPPS